MTLREKLAEARDRLRDLHVAALDFDGLPRDSLFVVFSAENPHVAAFDAASLDFITLRQAVEDLDRRKDALEELLTRAHSLVLDLDQQALADEGEDRNGRLHRAASAAALAATLLRREVDGEPVDEDPDEA